MTGIELLWGIATNLASSALENSLPETTYIQHLRRVLHKTTTIFSAKYLLKNPDNKILFYNSQTFYTECLKFRYYAKPNANVVHQALKQDDRIADCTKDNINDFLNLLFDNANNDGDLKKYFLEGHYREEVFVISQRLGALMEELKQAQTNTININGDNNIIVQDAKDIILNILNNQVKEEERKQDKRLQAYKAKMAEDYEKTIFEETNVRLCDIYIEQHYGVHNECQSIKSVNSSGAFKDTKEHIHHFIENWINYNLLPNYIENRYINKRVLLLLGQPGQGKSSFCSRLMYDALQQQGINSSPIFRINFRRIQDINRLFNNPLTALYEFLNEKENLILHKDIFRNSILVLDGLDELMMQEKGSATQEDIFFRKLINDVDENYPNIRVIITSRHQVDTEKIAKDCLVINLSILTFAKQITWLMKYRDIRPDIALDVDTLKEFQKEKHIAELSNQPILLYLLAQVHSKEQPIDFKSNRATLYKQLFDMLIERRWADRKQISALKGLDTITLRLLLREIAFAIFQSDYEYVHKTDIPNIMKNNTRLEGKHDIIDKESSKGLMLAFYMQEIDKTSVDEDRISDKSNYGIEFMHKSLQEYLVAEYIWEQVKEIAEKKTTGDFYVRDWKSVLDILCKCFKDKFITSNITELLIELIQNDKQVEAKETLANRLGKYFDKFIATDFLLHYDSNQNISPIKACLNTFYGFLTVISHTASDYSYILINKQYFADLLIALRRYKYDCDILLSIPDVCSADLSGVDLSGAYLSNVYLNEIDLSGSDLNGAIFIDANLSGANLSRSNLNGTNFRRATLDYVDLSSSYLNGANLSDTYLYSANLSGANLSGADLSDAILSNVDLSYADLSRTNLSKVDLSRAILSNANLSGADLTGANLNSANMTNTDLSRTIMSRVNITQEQLLSAKSLFNCQGLSYTMKFELKRTHRYLFKKL